MCSYDRVRPPPPLRAGRRCPRDAAALAEAGRGGRRPARPRTEADEDATGPGRVLLGRALALAPSLGGEQRVGEVSGAAEASSACAAGWRSARRSRAVPSWCCSRPTRSPWPRPGRASCARWKGSARRSSPRAPASPASRSTGCAGCTAPTRPRSPPRRTPGASVRRGRARVGAGPTRFCALAGALAARSRRPLMVGASEAHRWLAGRPVGLLGHRARPRRWCGRSSGSACARSASSRGWGAPRSPTASARPAARAPARLRRGHAAAPAPRRGAPARDDVGRRRELRPGARARARRAAGPAAGPSRASWPHAARGDALGAPDRRRRLARARGLPPSRSCEPERIWLALSARLRLLPAPAAELGLTVERFGSRPGEQSALLDRDRDRPRRAPARGHRPDARRRPGRTPRCGPSAWSPTRASPSGG